MIIKNKKADEGGGLPISYVIVAILLLACLAIALIWWIGFKPINQINTTDCTNSIALRDAANMVTVAKVNLLPVDSIPLQCKTEKICYSNKGSLDSVLDLLQSRQAAKKQAEAAGLTWDCPADYQVTPVSSQNDLIADLVKRMATWWSTTGQGNKDYHSSKWFSFHDTYCLLGTIMKFDSSIWSNPSMQTITYNDLWTYMASHNVPNTNTNYFQYLYGQKSLDDVKKALADQYKITNSDIGNKAINTGYDQTILTGVVKPGHGAELAIAGGVVLVVVAVVAAPVVLPAIGIGGAAGGTGTAATAGSLEAAGIYSTGGMTFVDMTAFNAAMVTEAGQGTALLGAAATAKLALASAGGAFILARESSSYPNLKFIIPTIIPTKSINFNTCENFDTLASPPENSS